MADWLSETRVFNLATKIRSGDPFYFFTAHTSPLTAIYVKFSVRVFRESLLIYTLIRTRIRLVA
jgi:hypothetical protein